MARSSRKQKRADDASEADFFGQRSNQEISHRLPEQRRLGIQLASNAAEALATPGGESDEHDGPKQSEGGGYDGG